MYASAKQAASGEVPPIEKAGVFEAYLKDDTKSVTSELLSKEVHRLLTSFRAQLLTHNYVVGAQHYSH
jgi:hypothetical protein